jgi:6-methylsalicylate decarboxylase
MTTAQRIDVHHHILPPHYVNAVGPEPIAVQGSSGRVPFWSVEDALATLDAAGIDTAITSITSPGVAPLSDARQATALAHECNLFAASLVRDHAGRFGMFTTLALQDIDAALAETAFAFDTLRADGVCLLSNHDGLYLGEDFYRPLYEEMNRRAAVVFVHPTSPQQRVSVAGLSASTLEFPFDTTRALASIVFSGVAQDYPAIRWIFSHAGGAMPYLAGRIDMLTRNNRALRERIPDGFAAVLGKFYFDTALSADPVHFAALRALVPDDQLLLGTDYPFGPKGQASETVNALASLGGGPGTRAKLESLNALQLFPRWATPTLGDAR